MTIVAANLIQGPANLYAADYGATEPLDTAVATAPASPYEILGATSGGVTWSRNAEYSEMEVDQVPETVERRLTKVEVVISTNLAEGTLENLARAANTSSASVTSGTGYKSLAMPAGEAAMASPYYQSIILDGKGTAGKRRRVIVRKSLNVANMEGSYEKGSMTLIPVEFTGHYISEAVRSVHVVDQV